MIPSHGVAYHEDQNSLSFFPSRLEVGYTCFYGLVFFLRFLTIGLTGGFIATMFSDPALSLGDAASTGIGFTRGVFAASSVFPPDSLVIIPSISMFCCLS